MRLYASETNPYGRVSSYRRLPFRRASPLGTVVETSDYLPFGTRWSQTGGSSTSTFTDPDNRWRYSGKEEQAALDTGIPLIDNGARMYDPVIARWMSADQMVIKT